MGWATAWALGVGPINNADRASEGPSPHLPATARSRCRRSQGCHAEGAVGRASERSGINSNMADPQSLIQPGRVCAIAPQVRLRDLVHLVTEFPPHDFCGFAGSAELLKGAGGAYIICSSLALCYPTSSIHPSASSLTRRVRCASVLFASCRCLLCGCGHLHSVFSCQALPVGLSVRPLTIFFTPWRPPVRQLLARHAASARDA